MKMQVTILDIEEKESKAGNKYASAQVIFHDDQVTAGPISFFGDAYQKCKDLIKKNGRYMANLKLQPDRNGTQVEILGLEAIKPA